MYFLASPLRFSVLLFLCFPIAAAAQPKPGDAMIEKYLAQVTAKISQRFLDGATTVTARSSSMYCAFSTSPTLWGSWRRKS